MKKAIILHGTFGSPEGNWFRWLESELASRDIQVWLPLLPKATQPSLREWAEFIFKNCPFAIDENTLIVGHSSGAILSLIIAQQCVSVIGAIVAVSAFRMNAINWEPNNRLFDVEFEWGTVRSNVKKIFFLASDTDPYIPIDQPRYMAEHCNAELIVIPDQGHFNLEQSSDYKQFPRLLTLMHERNML